MAILDLNNVHKSSFMGNPSEGMRGQASDLFKPIWSNPPRRATSQWIDLMQKSPRTDPLHKIASDLASTPFKLYAKIYNPDTKRMRKEIQSHISLDLLDKPCPMDKTITRSRLFYMTEMYLLSPAGECAWLLERNGLGVPSEIYIIPPHWILATPTKQIPYFRILPMGNSSYQTVYVDPEDIIWFKEQDLLYPYGRGRGRSEGIGDEIETDEYMAKWQKMKFFNGAEPTWVGMMPGADEPTIDRTKENWYKELGGYKNAHKMKFINWDAKFQKMSESETEMDFIESRKFLRDTCLQHYNMPPELFGIVENSNRSTIDAAYELYTRNSLSIQLRSFDDILNRQYFPLFDEKLFIEHDNVIPADKEYELKKAESGLKNGGWLVDEYRIATGKDPLPDGKGHVLYTPLNMMPTNIDEDDVVSNSPAVNDSKPPGKSVHKHISKTERRERLWKLHDNGAYKYERNVSKAVSKYFKAQQGRVLKAFNKSYMYGVTKDVEDFEDIDWDEEDKALKDSLRAYYLAVAKEGSTAASNLYSLDIDWDLLNPAVKRWVEEYGLKAAKNINETTKQKLRDTLAEGVENGESNPKLRDRIQDVYSEATSSRASLIARTETHNAYAQGNYQTYKKAGATKKQWLSAQDGRVRDTHAGMDGEIVSVDESFSNGLEYPGDPAGDPAEVCNCRCTFEPVWEDNESGENEDGEE